MVKKEKEEKLSGKTGELKKNSMGAEM